MAILDQLVQGTKAYDRRGWSRSEKGGRNLIVSHLPVLLGIGKKWWRKKEWPEKGTCQSKGKWPLKGFSRLKERYELMFVFAPLIKPKLFTVYTSLIVNHIVTVWCYTCRYTCQVLLV